MLLRVIIDEKSNTDMSLDPPCTMSFINFVVLFLSFAAMAFSYLVLPQHLSTTIEG